LVTQPTASTVGSTLDSNVILAVVQGLAELLPVSSSAHVIVAAKLTGLNPSTPEMTLLLVMLHTGTMFAVILYFWRAWKNSLFASCTVFRQQAIRLLTATMLTAAVGLPLILGIEKSAERSGCLVNDASGCVRSVRTPLSWLLILGLLAHTAR
jgi:undecaprenyl pyrophosphate phosphatase UppP